MLHTKYQSSLSFSEEFWSFLFCSRPSFNSFPNKPWFLLVSVVQVFENTKGKGEFAHNEQFLLFSQCFLPVLRPFWYFHQFWICRLQALSVCKSPKFVVWERVKPRGIIWKNLVEVYQQMLHREYQSSVPATFREEEFWRFPFFALCLNLWPQARTSFAQIYKLGRGPLRDATYEISKL